MSKFVVVIFASETKAYEGTRALKQLHAEGSLTVYGMAVVAKQADGKIEIKQTADDGPLGTGVGALVGGLVGLLGGPVGAAIGMSAGAYIGLIGDIVNAGVQTDFLDTVSARLTPGKTAVVAEVEEDWLTPLDVRMESIGGEVIREWRDDFEDAQIEKSIQRRQAEFARLKEEWSRASAERKAKLKGQMDAAQAQLEKAIKSAQDRVRELEQEATAKIKELEQQAAKAKGDAKAAIEKRIADTRADYDRRIGLLNQAWQLTKQAFAAE